MRVWIDGQCLQTASRLRGIGRYVQQLLQGIALHEPSVTLSISFNAALPDDAVAAAEAVAPFIPRARIHVWQGIAEKGEAAFGHTARRRLSEIALAHHVATLAPDIALSASPFEGGSDVAVPLLPDGAQDFPLGAIFYDAIPHRYPTRYLGDERARSYYDRRFEAVGRMDFLLAISDFSAAEARVLLAVAQVSTIHAGVSDEFTQLLGARGGACAHGDVRYLLYVGALDWRKNVLQVVHAFALLPATLRRELRFFLAGDASDHHKDEIAQAWDLYGLPPQHLRFFGHVSDQTLVALYSDATLAIQPSLMEGFGLTALEAMRCGTPVVASATGALGEVVGLPELLFDPEDPRDIARCIAHAATTTHSARADFIAHGLARAERFTWQRSASLTRVALEHALSQRPQTTSSLDQRRRRACVQAVAISRDAPLCARLLAAAEPLAPTPPRLLIDVTAIAYQDGATGIQRVVKQMAAHLPAAIAAFGLQAILVFCDDTDGFYPAQQAEDGAIHFAGKRGQQQILPAHGDTLLMLDSSWDFHAAHHTALREARLRGCRVITVLYDLIPLMAPAFCRPDVPGIYLRALEVTLRYANGVVAISGTVQRECARLLRAIRFPRPLGLGHWPLGGDFAALTGSDGAPPALPAARPQFLMVGTLEPRKGHAVALDAFEALWRAGFDGALVIAGRVGWDVTPLVRRIRSHPEYGKRLIWFETVADGQLQGLYRACDAVIAASYAEGFGLPIVEAAAYAKPVIASDLPVFREVASPDTRFLPPGDPRALGSALRAHGASPPLPSLTRPPLTWRDSAAMLADLLTGDAWTEIHQPPADHAIATASRLGTLAMDRMLAGDDTRHRLALVQPATPDDEGAALRIVVKLTNLSPVSWSSLSAENERYVVALGSRPHDAGGQRLAVEGRTLLPFVAGPGDALFLAVTIPLAWIAQGAASVDIEMVQEACSWWGDALRVALPGGSV